MAGIYMSLYLGVSSLDQAPGWVMERVQSVSVTEGETRSGFQLQLGVERSGLSGQLDDRLLSLASLQPGSRVAVAVTIGGRSTLLVDGVITRREFRASGIGGGSLSLTGRDVSALMEREERRVTYTAHADHDIVQSILSQYAVHGLIPRISEPQSRFTPGTNDHRRSQRSTDLAMVNVLARENDYVFHVTPGPEVGQNQAWWGPRASGRSTQRALAFGIGSDSTVESISFHADSEARTLINDSALDPDSGSAIQLTTTGTRSDVDLGGEPMMPAESVIKVLAPALPPLPYGVLSSTVQSMTDRRSRRELAATGELRVDTYGGVLRARQTVDVKGVGWTHDGPYFVEEVRHTLERGRYTQGFTLARAGQGAA